MVDEKVADETASEASPDAEEPRLHCDFCGDEAPQVRRIALDGPYDRLQRPHHPQYACERCSVEKERARLESASG